MDLLAGTADIEGLWRPLSQPEKDRAWNLLAMASAVVRSKVPTVDDRIAADTLDEQIVRGVVAQMVIRALQNPGGLRTKSVGSVSVAFDSATSGIVLMDDEANLLAPPRKPKVGTARLAAGLGYGRWCD